MDERDDILSELVDRRRRVYGNPTETFARIAQMWSGLIDHKIEPYQVPLMMVAMKLVRTDVTPDYADNSDDISGYMDIFRQIIGDDMIRARTVDEFIEKKWPQVVHPSLFNIPYGPKPRLVEQDNEGRGYRPLVD